MRQYHKPILAVISIITIFITVLTSPITASAWGDSDGGRPSYSLQQIGEDVLGDQIIFNSIEIVDTDYEWYKNYFGTEIPKTTITHEKNFVGARKCIQRADGSVEGDAKDTLWDGNQIQVDNGSVYIIRAYLHNDCPNGDSSVAENTKVSFVGLNDKSTLQEVDIVDETGKATGEKAMRYQIEINGLISSSNASPEKYWDNVNFQSDIPFHLEYIHDSALLENNGFASKNNIYNVPGGGNGPVQLSNDIVNESKDGVLIGYYGLDGRVPGGYQYAQYVSIKARVIYDYDFTVEQKVRMSDTKEWSKTIEAKVGDKVDFQIQYKNTSNQPQESVIIRNTLPSNLHYVEGSAKIKDSDHPDGSTINENLLLADGLKIGRYDKGENAYLMFTAEVVDDNLACGPNTLVNWLQIDVDSTIRQDYATVEVAKDGVFIIISIILLLLIIFCFIMVVVLFKIIRKQKHHTIP